jgi:hypothetical protein
MLVRRSPAIVLSLVLGAAALLSAPGAAWSDGGAPAVEKDGCSPSTATRAKLKVSTLGNNNSRLQVIGAVFSNDDDVWLWKLRHNGDMSDSGRARGDEETDLSFRVTTTMINFIGSDDVVFRAENQSTGEVCRVSVSF